MLTNDIINFEQLDDKINSEGRSCWVEAMNASEKQK